MGQLEEVRFPRWSESCECVWWPEFARKTVPNRHCSMRGEKSFDQTRACTKLIKLIVNQGNIFILKSLVAGSVVLWVFFVCLTKLVLSWLVSLKGRVVLSSTTARQEQTNACQCCSHLFRLLRSNTYAYSIQQSSVEMSFVLGCTRARLNVRLCSVISDWKLESCLCRQWSRMTLLPWQHTCMEVWWLQRCSSGQPERQD